MFPTPIIWELIIQRKSLSSISYKYSFVPGVFQVATSPQVMPWEEP